MPDAIYCRHTDGKTSLCNIYAFIFEIAKVANLSQPSSDRQYAQRDAERGLSRHMPHLLACTGYIKSSLCCFRPLLSLLRHLPCHIAHTFLSFAEKFCIL